MHDAHEAVVQDVVTPLKELLPQYRMIEAMAQYAMSRRYEIAFELPAEVKTADAIMLKVEADFFGMDTSRFNLPADLPRVKVRIERWNPRTAKARFLARFNELNAPRWKA